MMDVDHCPDEAFAEAVDAYNDALSGGADRFGDLLSRLDSIVSMQALRDRLHAAQQTEGAACSASRCAMASASDAQSALSEVRGVDERDASDFAALVLEPQLSAGAAGADARQAAVQDS